MKTAPKAARPGVKTNNNARMMSYAKIIEVATIWLVLALYSNTISAENKTKQLYVIPHYLARTDCLTHYCYTLNELFGGNVANNSCISSNTRIIFLPGEHLVLQHGSFLVQHIHNLEITSKEVKKQNNPQNDGIEENATAKIVCNNTVFGITFLNITNLTISNIAIAGCGAPIPTHVDLGYSSFNGLNMNYTLVVAHSYNATIHGLSITNGRGVGILLYNVFTSFNLSHSVFTSNDINCYIVIAEKNFMRKYAYNGTAQIYKTNITFGNNSLIQSRRTSTSGIEIKIVNVIKFHIRISDILLSDNYASEGQFDLSLIGSTVDVDMANLTVKGEIVHNIGLNLDGDNTGRVTIIDSYFKGTCLRVNTQIPSSVLLKGSIIESCKGTGLALFSTNIVLNDVHISNNVGYMVEVVFTTQLTIEGDCTFYNNTGTFLIDTLEAEVIFSEGSRTQFTNNVNTCIDKCCQCSTVSLHGASIEIRNARIYFKNNVAKESGGILIAGGSLQFVGNSSIIFEDNIGENGGAMKISIDGYLMSTAGDFPRIEFIRNRARQKGGAIFTTNDFSKSSFVCLPDSQILFYFINNSASEAGSAIYGNLRSIMEPYQNPLIGCDPDYIYIEGKSNDYSKVSSEPVRVCMCANSVPNCSITERESEIYPGQIFIIEAVAVGLRYGTVPSTVQAEYDRTEYSWLRIGGGQYLQHVNNNCTTLRYETVLDFNQMRQLKLTTRVDDDALKLCKTKFG